jgi:putative ABC transport system permease protein
MKSILQDLRFAARRIVKDRWFTVASIVALALGIGANSAVFTLVNAVLLRGLPLDNADRIMWIDSRDQRGRGAGVSFQDYEDWRAASRTFNGMTLVQNGTMIISGDDPLPESYPGGFISANAFDVIGVKTQLGRGFVPEDDKEGAPAVALISGGIWKSRYASDPAIIGKAVRVNTIPATIVGVMPDGFKWPFQSEVWLPMSQRSPVFRLPRQGRSFMAYGRLADGATLEQARSEMKNIAAQLANQYQDSNKDLTAQVTPFLDFVIGPQIKTMFWALMGAVAFVLLIACSNVANLLLARAADRSREIAVRVALGASRWRVVRQLLVESVLLAVVSGIVGLGLGYMGIQWFDGESQNIGRPYWMKFDMDARVFAFFAVVCVATGILFGLAPALHISKTNVNDIMKEGGRSGSGGVRARRWTAALIVAELTLTLVLLAGAGFMMRSFLALYRMDLGIDSSRVLTMRLSLPLGKYPKPEPRTLLFQHLEERLHGVSAIQASAVTSNLPMLGGFLRQLTVEGRPDRPGERPPEVTVVSVGAGYFETLGMKMIRGRTLNDSDGTAGHEGVLVNQRFVAMHFAGEDPVGQRIRLVDATPARVYDATPPLSATIVGVVPTVRQRNFQEPDPDPVAYVPYRTDPQRFVFLVVRGQGDPAALTSLVREQMRAIEPDLPLFGILTLDQMLAQMRFSFRVFGSMFAIFAVIALVLSAVGLYAVTAYAVSQRTAEIGVRMALGAQSSQVLWLMMRQALWQLAVGLPIGVAGAFAVGRLLQSVLAQTNGRDPVTVAAIAVLMAAVSMAACFWPARRATRLDPVAALRNE